MQLRKQEGKDNQKNNFVGARNLGQLAKELSLSQQKTKKESLVGGTKLREEEEVIVRPSGDRREWRGDWTGTGQRGLIRTPDRKMDVFM